MRIECGARASIELVDVVGDDVHELVLEIALDLWSDPAAAERVRVVQVAVIASHPVPVPHVVVALTVAEAVPLACTARVIALDEGGVDSTSMQEDSSLTHDACACFEVVVGDDAPRAAFEQWAGW